MDDLLDLVVAYRTLADQGILDAYGHVSIRSKADPQRYFMSRALAPEIVRRSDLMEFTLESEPCDQQGRELYSERFIHGEIYKSRPDVGAIVHNHSPTIVPFSITKVSLRRSQPSARSSGSASRCSRSATSSSGATFASKRRSWPP